MKYIIIFLAIFCINTFAFNPNDIIGGDVKEVGICPPVACAVIEKDNVDYLVTFIPDQDGETAYILEIFVIKNKKLHKVWSIKWKEV